MPSYENSRFLVSVRSFGNGIEQYADAPPPMQVEKTDV